MLVKLRVGFRVAACLCDEHKCSVACSGSSDPSVTARRRGLSPTLPFCPLFGSQGFLHGDPSASCSVENSSPSETLLELF